MSTNLSDITGTELSVRYRAPQVSAELNRKLYTALPRGVYKGFVLSTSVSALSVSRRLLLLVDRKKELIKPGGFQVWPREVEEAISAHPKVLETGVGGIPDPNRGETVKAWVVLKPGETLSADEVRAFCKQRLAPYKVPTHVEFRTELPKTTVGKILRRELVRQHKEGGK